MAARAVPASANKGAAKIQGDRTLPSRREILACTAAALAAAALPARAGAAAPSLREIGSARGIEVGSAFSGSGSPEYLEILRTHCDVITPEWQIKPHFLKPDRFGPYRFAEADAIRDFCRENGQKLHGHALFWHADAIRWAESGNFSTVKRLYGGFLRDVVAHYADVPSWDVVNEIVEEQTPLRDDFLLSRFGHDFVDFCFRTVHEAAPEARLVVNDYNLSCGESWCDAKRANMLRLLESLLKRGTPVHAVGMQCHLSSRYETSPRAAAEFVRQVADLGLDIYISELDLNDVDFADDVATRDRQVADHYEEFLSAMLANKAVRRVCFWGISDSANWIARGHGEADRKPDPRPVLFDANDEPKPAFDAVRRALEAAPAR
ncbi:endo-1,4-beta-xylanase [Aquamicrobium sp. LC103]|uniref:endo-1,4-beta-xylanase n=1 Tax=Aquamicrobium sp. LC103 TaxID=1120658 RepID=UPI00063EADBF|nr:endo-1,4-beta-xylanase [Aquamicrobium sp. LC103]TKT80342.1 endo-1,4-beta-xylanase [Aquamicrobium sp. LC103]